MPKNFDASAVTFLTEQVGMYQGQKYLRLYVFEHGAHVGSLEYGDYRGEPTLHFIGVAEQYSRRGFATAMLQRLQQMYPGRQIGWMAISRDATAFFSSVRFIKKTVKSIIDRRRHLDGLVAERDATVASLAAYDTCRDPSPAMKHRAKFERRDLADLNANIDDLEVALAGKSPVIFLVDTTEAVPVDAPELVAAR